MIDSPSITIAVPTFNRPILLNRALESIASQARFANEVIIGDNSSDEASEDVFLRWKDQIPNLVYNKRSTNVGPVKNFILLASEATSQYILWLADDDVLHPTAVYSIASTIQKYPYIEYLGWAYQVKNYVTGDVSDCGAPLSVSIKNSYYVNTRNYLKAPASPFFYGCYKSICLKNSILVHWAQSSVLFDWMDVAFVTSILSRSKAHYIDNVLVTYGVDEITRPMRGSDGNIVSKFNPWPWLYSGSALILNCSNFSNFQKLKLILLFLVTWRKVTSHALFKA
jgi:glycosyltransferase involved in cell wall biosynthesis